jgi:hypothetical protein
MQPDRAKVAIPSITPRAIRIPSRASVMLRSHPCIVDVNSHKTAFTRIVGTFAPVCRVPAPVGYLPRHRIPDTAKRMDPRRVWTYPLQFATQVLDGTVDCAVRHDARTGVPIIEKLLPRESRHDMAAKKLCRRNSIVARPGARPGYSAFKPTASMLPRSPHWP